MMPSGAHFSDESWMDFARGLASDLDRAAMRAHLDSGCESCAATVRLFRAVAAAVTSPTQVPDRLTAAAVALFQPRSEEPDWIEKLIPLPARLVFGHSLDWQPEGVRAAEPEGNRAVYLAGGYSVDLSMEVQESSERHEMVGQISQEGDAERKLGEVIVQVLASGKTVSETATNQFGEFMIELPSRNYAVLRFAMKHQGYRIDLPLKIPVRKWRLP